MPAYWLPTLVEYVILCRVPLFFGTLLFLLPWVAFKGARSLFAGLFDVTPLSAFAVSIANAALAAASSFSVLLIALGAHDRFGVPQIDSLKPLIGVWWVWPAATLILSAPIAFTVVSFSSREGHPRSQLLISTVLGLSGVIGLIAAIQGTLLHMQTQFFLNVLVSQPGYGSRNNQELLNGQVLAIIAFCALLIIYAVLGRYGYKRLGKEATVPALCSALMLLTLICTFLSGISFFFDRWRVPVLLILAVVGVLTTHSRFSDHYYDLAPRAPEDRPSAKQVIQGGPKRIIVAAAQGGGIQSAAWTAQVLSGLQQHCGPTFRESLRLLSTVSGGSVGGVLFAYSLDNPNGRDPVKAASDSSLDEVAWGLAWPDFLRAILPWVFGHLIGRGRALEKAWCLSAAANPEQGSGLDHALSSWNRRAAEGSLPAIIMNATVCETGERLLLGTTGIERALSAEEARLDATELHGPENDVGIVTAARLSASFPYVTPAARSTLDGPRPHVVDGGYYDNYGMATLVEWLDEALTTGGDCIASVLVLQIHGIPVKAAASRQSKTAGRGWFYQLFAPVTTLVNVRSAGQIAHNDIELALIQTKWNQKNIPVHSVLFEFPNPDPPLSWHLTPTEKKLITAEWDTMGACVQKVSEFLAGRDDLGCDCPRCKQALSGVATHARA